MNNELLAILDYLERDRGLDREVLTKLIEEALLTAARKAVGPANELTVHLDPKSGDILATAQLEVVERVLHPDREIGVAEARVKQPGVKVGDHIAWEVTPKNFGRIAAQTAKQGIMQRLRQAEKERVSNEYKDKLGEVLYGVVTRFDKGDIVIDFGRAEGLLKHAERVFTEDYQIGDHICCVLVDVNVTRPGPVLEVSRSSPQLVKRLFEREVTEINEKIVEIRSVAREPGFRSKIAVHSHDGKVDPVGACVGLRGSRVKTIVRELSGEKVDIIRWDADIRTFVKNALQPAEIASLQVDEASQTVHITVNPDQLSLAIGRRGQNARLTAKLTGWKVDIMRGEEKKGVSIAENMKLAADSLLAAIPGLTDEQAQKLVAEGFLSVEGLRVVDEDDLADVDGIGPVLAQQIKSAIGEAP